MFHISKPTLQLNQPYLQILRRFFRKQQWCKSSRTDSAGKAGQIVTFSEINTTINFVYQSEILANRRVKILQMLLHLVPMWETPAEFQIIQLIQFK